jgi:allophanate hydrolase subunit 2
MGAIEVTARGGFVGLADDENGERVLGPDATHILASGAARARYLAVPGGFNVPTVMGSQTTLLIAGLGGHGGRALKKGDILLPCRDDIRSPADLEAVPLDVPVQIVPGPDATDKILDGIASGSFTVSQVSDRTGVRLEGPKLDAPAASGRSGPMVEGVMQLTSSGLIVLGPDHPTTGGYPIVAVLSENTRDSFFARPPGSTVRFNVAGARLV